MTRMRADIEKPLVITSDGGAPLEFAGVSGRLKIDGKESGHRFAAAYFPSIPPHVLAAPLHRHHQEDEYTFVVRISQLHAERTDRHGFRQCACAVRSVRPDISRAVASSAYRLGTDAVIASRS